MRAESNRKFWESLMQEISLIMTGGTIEKIYSEQTGAVLNVDGKIESYLCRLRLPDCLVRLIRVLNKDSQAMDAVDRSSLLSLRSQIA
jgi:L-asparaginase/Glu-tRNA(Gln) amidotransferase subunit D